MCVWILGSLSLGERQPYVSNILPLKSGMNWAMIIKQKDSLKHNGDNTMWMLISHGRDCEKEIKKKQIVSDDLFLSSMFFFAQ